MLHPNSIFSRSQFYKISITICFSRAKKNKFNRLPFTRNMQSRFQRMAVTFTLGAYFWSLAMSHILRAHFHWTCLFFEKNSVALSSCISLHYLLQVLSSKLISYWAVGKKSASWTGTMLLRPPFGTGTYTPERLGRDALTAAAALPTYSDIISCFGLIKRSKNRTSHTWKTNKTYLHGSHGSVTVARHVDLWNDLDVALGGKLQNLPVFVNTKEPWSRTRGVGSRAKQRQQSCLLQCVMAAFAANLSAPIKIWTHWNNHPGWLNLKKQVTNLLNTTGIYMVTGVIWESAQVQPDLRTKKGLLSMLSKVLLIGKHTAISPFNT